MYMYIYLPNTHIIKIRQPQVRQPQGKPRGDGWGVEGHVQLCRHALCSQTCQPARPDQLDQAQLWRNTYFYFYFSWRQEKTRQDPCSMDRGRFSRVCCYLYRLGGRRLGGETWVGDTRRERFFWGVAFGDGSAELPRLGGVCERKRERKCV